MSLTITPSPFGSLLVSVAENGSTLSVTTVATSPSVLSMALGVPGPAGATGSQGPAGANGVGVAAGGTTGQALVKLSSTDYDTGWATITSGGGTWGSITGTLSNQTDLQSALDGKLSLSGGTMTGDIIYTETGGFGNIRYTNQGVRFDGTGGFFSPEEGLNLGQGNITFSDATIQTTAGLPLTGGTMTADSIIYIPSIPEEGGTYSRTSNTANGIEIKSLDFQDYILSQTNYQLGGISASVVDSSQNFNLNYNGVYGANSDSISWGIGTNGVTFPDATTQTTSATALLGNYLPLAGGTLTGDITFPAVGTGNDSLIGTFGFGTENITLGQSASIEPNQIAITTSGVGIEITSSAITFPNGSTQAIAFPGYNGTTSQYIRGDGSLNTFPPVGDRYLTSSTSTLTVDSDNGKTMTVGTGLSYSPQQDITVSYNTANHMHGTVLTYNSTTGVMTWDSNTHSGSGTYSSWEVNVGGVAGAILPVGGTAGQVLAKINSTNFNTEWVSLGSASTLSASAILQTANNLSDLSSSSTARTNLGLGSMATQSTSAYLSSSAIASTYQTQSAMSAYLSTSAAASTYQTQSGMSAYLSTASASANFIGTSAYATTAQAQAGTSTTTVINPSTLLDAKWFSGGKYLTQIAWATATTGVGASASAGGINGRLLTAPTTATGNALQYGNISNASRGNSYLYGFDWTKRFTFGFRLARNVTSPDSNSVFRAKFGTTTATVGDISTRAIEVKVSGSGALQLLVHNGTTLITATSSYSLTNATAFDVVGVSDGSGNATLYVNGSSVATSTGAATTNSAGSQYILCEVENTSTIASGTGMIMNVTDIFIQQNI